MATFTANSAPSPVRFDLFNVADLVAGTAQLTSPTDFIIGPNMSSGTIFTGSGFTFSAGLFATGTINRIERFNGADSLFVIENIALPVPQFRAFVTAGNSQGFLAAVFAGADTLTGSQFDDYLQGFAGNDFIAGDANLAGGDDTLDGGLGADTMFGSEGNDFYFVDNAKDFVQGETNAVASGFDTVQSKLSYVLGLNLEHLLLTGTAALSGTGNDLANRIVGNAGNNILLGLGANDSLEGGAGNDKLDGGTGNDNMLGGAGNDIYTVDDVLDMVTESIGGKAGGIDIVFSSAGITLGANIENLTLTGSNAINAFGNQLANVITAKNSHGGSNQLSGFDGNDTIIGSASKDILAGGLGADSVSGGKGDDSYLIDDSDKIAETFAGSAGGTDTVEYTGTKGHTLGGNFENLSLMPSTGAVFGIGNGLDNQIAGNTDANLLDGKAGRDTLLGSGGNDTYIVDNALDVVDEGQLSGDGFDTIKSSIDFDLNINGTTVVGNLEHLVLLGKAVTGTGNALDNQITGNAGKNGLSGLGGSDTLDGGTGNDTLVGGSGNDLYIIDSKLDIVIEGGADAADRINSSKISVDISTAGFATIENIELTGKLALSATGNGAGNIITGNDGANKLSGLGGIDTLDGAGGNDVLSGGTDKDFLTGGNGNDTLDGGADLDTLSGGNGNDTYIVESGGPGPVSDFVDEAGAGGIDTVISSAKDFSLSGNTSGEVENLTLATGAGNTSGDGNGANNILTGNEGDNTLGGAAGNDTINGGAGNDRVLGNAGDDAINVALGNDEVHFNSVLDGHDLITGFDGNPTGGQDVINLANLLGNLGISPVDRPSHVLIIDHGSTVDIRIDADKNLINGHELTVATIQTVDAVTFGSDVILG